MVGETGRPVVGEACAGSGERGETPIGPEIRIDVQEADHGGDGGAVGVGVFDRPPKAGDAGSVSVECNRRPPPRYSRAGPDQLEPHNQCERAETLPNQNSGPGRRAVPSAISTFQCIGGPRPVPSSLRSGSPFIRRPPPSPKSIFPRACGAISIASSRHRVCLRRTKNLLDGTSFPLPRVGVANQGLAADRAEKIRARKLPLAARSPCRVRPFDLLSLCHGISSPLAGLAWTRRPGSKATQRFAFKQHARGVCSPNIVCSAYVQVKSSQVFCDRNCRNMGRQPRRRRSLESDPRVRIASAIAPRDDDSNQTRSALAHGLRGSTPRPGAACETRRAGGASDATHPCYRPNREL